MFSLFSSSLMLFIFKIKKPPGTAIGSVISFSVFLDSIDFNFLFKELSSIHPISPPIDADLDILNLNAALLNPF